MRSTECRSSCPVDDTVFKVSPEIRCSGMSSRSVVMETTQLVLSQFKNFLSHPLKIEQGPSLPKAASKFCELVKLCHINRSGPVFLRHSVVREGPTPLLNGIRYIRIRCHVVFY